MYDVWMLSAYMYDVSDVCCKYDDSIPVLFVHCCQCKEYGPPVPFSGVSIEAIEISEAPFGKSETKKRNQNQKIENLTRSLRPLRQDCEAARLKYGRVWARNASNCTAVTKTSHKLTYENLYVKIMSYVYDILYIYIHFLYYIIYTYTTCIQIL